MNIHQIKQQVFNNIWYRENRRESNADLWIDDYIFSATQSLLYPNYSRVWGFDESHWGGKVDISRAKSIGASFCFLKAIDGTLQTNYFLDNRQRAIDAGLPHGPYGWLYRNSNVSCVAQAQAYTTLMNKYPPVLPCVIDFEPTKYGGVQSNPNYDDLRKWAVEWLRLGNPKAILYSAKGYMNGFGQIPNDLKNMFAGIWIANTGVSSPNMPLGYGANDWEFWQWTFSGDQNYIAPSELGKLELDLNYYNGTHEQFAQKYGAGEVPPPTGEPMTVLYKADLKPNLISNVRSGAGKGYDVVEQIKGPLTVEITGEKVTNVYDWYPISAPVVGWIALTTSYNNFRAVGQEPTGGDIHLDAILKADGTITGTWTES